ncbi:hypothetical protein ACGFY6_19045 [Streptomyces sp. NPDC048387]|uniref:hypothetical protein n=1 Tax=Streptomyces sp. NPDC048387 TaxID=3365542 RepID=UPI0037181E7C
MGVPGGVVPQGVRDDEVGGAGQGAGKADEAFGVLGVRGGRGRPGREFRQDFRLDLRGGALRLPLQGAGEERGAEQVRDRRLGVGRARRQEQRVEDGVQRSAVHPPPGVAAQHQQGRAQPPQGQGGRVAATAGGHGGTHPGEPAVVALVVCVHEPPP